MTRTRLSAPIGKPVVLTIAGSDSGGGAGIQADLKTIEATGGFGVSAITAVTAQNTRGVESSHVLPIEEIEAQIDAISSDFDVRAVKTGMLATAEVVATVAEYAADFECPVVVDPVMVATSGDRLLSEPAETAYEDLIAEATLVTPNADEAAVLTGIDPTDESSARAAGSEILSVGAEAALIKGGHVGDSEILDALVTAESVEAFRHPRVRTDATHGSGCTLSSAIATRLARGDPLERAVEESVAFIERAVRYHHAVGEGSGPVHHLVGIRNEAGKHRAIGSVYEIVDRLGEADADAIESVIPEDGATVAVSTPYAESIDDVAATDGKAVGKGEGMFRGGVRLGASDPLVSRLLEVRERDPKLCVGIECRSTPSEAVASEATFEERTGGDSFLFAPSVEGALVALESGDADIA